MSKRLALEVIRTVRLTELQLGMLKAVCASALLLGALTGCGGFAQDAGAGHGSDVAAPQAEAPAPGARRHDEAPRLDFVPTYSGVPFTEMGDGSPSFSEDDLAAPEEAYAPLDGLGRCGTAMAIVSRDTMPTGERGSIGMVKPSGWHTVRYDDLIADRYLYNRCHLIGFQLTGENANERNLITGTRHMNVEGMLPFENLVADYVEETGNRVLYRVTPVFIGDELVARGVQMEAMSVEDGGAGVSFNVFCHNVQPGVEIDYATGGSRRAAVAEGHAHGGADGDDGAVAYVLNTGSGKFHLPDCPSVSKMSDRNRRDVTSAYDEMTAGGFSPCAICLSRG